MKLQGKVAVVLGASAEQGTGWAIAERFAREGARVVIAARRLAETAQLADRIGATAVACDASRQVDVAALAATALDAHGRVDIAVNAVGGTAAATIDGADDANLRAMWELNYLGHLYFIRHMARAMGAGGGSIILFSSLAATHPIEDLVTYGCAKAAANCLVRYAALEYGARNIRVNAILPATIRTDQSAQALAIPGMEALLASEVPLGRVGAPADFADAALWLAGPSFVTGLNLHVSGGNHLTRFARAAERSALAGEVVTV